MLEVTVNSCFFTYSGKKGLRRINNWESAPARKLIQFLGIDEQEVGLITVNGLKVNLEDTIPCQAKVSIWPFFHGG